MSHRLSASARTSPLVVKIGGTALDDAAIMQQLCASLAEVHRVNAGGLVLVHGGGAAVDEHLARLGMATQRREGLRITPPEQVQQIVAVLAGKVNKQLVGGLLRAGTAAVGLCLGDGRTARTQRYAPDGVDLGYVGAVDGGDPALLQLLLGAGYLPVLCSIGLDEQGEPLNVNADAAAAGIAAILGARGLALLTDVAAVHDADGAPIPTLDAGEVGRLIDDGTITGGMIAKVRSACALANEADRPVAIASWRDPSALRRLALGQRAGTSIVPSSRCAAVAAGVSA